ncbi:ATP-grasp domain-containing protein [Amycolatopsis sp. NPDC003731]
MAHVLFGDATQAGLHTIRRAVERGHYVTFVRGMSVHYYAVDDEFRALLDRVGEVIEIPDAFDADALTDAIGKAHARRPVDGVVGQYDSVLPALSEACERLQLPFTSTAGVRNVRNKALARQLLNEVGLASARFAVARNTDGVLRAAEKIGYPVVVKPVSGTDSIMASRADRPAEVRAAAEEIFAAAADRRTPELVRRLLDNGVLVEEHVEGELVSAELGVLRGKTWRFLITGRSRAAENDCIEMGAVLPAHHASVDEEACFAYAERVCRAVGLDHGVFHVEMIVTGEGPVLVEVNPRAMGGVMARLYKLLTGTDFCDYILDIHLGKHPRPGSVPRHRTITARRLMPRRSGTLPDQLDLASLERLTCTLDNFENFRIRPGAAVERQQVLGRFAVLGEDWADAMRRADELIPRFEERLGIPLIRPAFATAGTGLDEA